MRMMQSSDRLVELFSIAKEVVEFVKLKGVMPGEQCVLRDFAEKLWFADFPEEETRLFTGPRTTTG